MFKAYKVWCFSSFYMSNLIHMSQIVSFSRKESYNFRRTASLSSRTYHHGKSCFPLYLYFLRCYQWSVTILFSIVMWINKCSFLTLLPCCVTRDVTWILTFSFLYRFLLPWQITLLPRKRCCYVTVIRYQPRTRFVVHNCHELYISTMFEGRK